MKATQEMTMTDAAPQSVLKAFQDLGWEIYRPQPPKMEWMAEDLGRDEYVADSLTDLVAIMAEKTIKMAKEFGWDKKADARLSLAVALGIERFRKEFEIGAPISENPNQDSPPESGINN